LKPLRVISLLPSATEIVCALGLEKQLVGRSHECDFPTTIRDLPACTEANLDTSSSSSDIDRQVKDLLHNALSIYRIDVERIRQLRPDVILTQAQCEVCAVSLTQVEQEVKAALGPQTRILSLSPVRLADLWTDIVRVAEALGANPAATALVKGLKKRVAEILFESSRIKRRPAVACIEWLDPLMAAGNWVPELVTMVGGLNLFGEAGKHSPWLDWATVQKRDPDVVVVMPCGFDLARAKGELAALTSRPGWSKLRATRMGRVYLTDGNHYFNRPGPRLVESLEILAELLHPDRFRFGHEGRGWWRWK